MSTRKATPTVKSAGAQARPKTKAAARSKTEKAEPARKPRKTARAAAPAARTGRDAPDDQEVWTLRLYVTGRGERSERALSNLRRLCESNLNAVKYKIEVIDLLKNPELARDDQIIAIPTLVRKLPEPMKRIIGDLSNADRAMLSLDFPSSKNDSVGP